MKTLAAFLTLLFLAGCSSGHKTDDTSEPAAVPVPADVSMPEDATDEPPDDLIYKIHSDAKGLLQVSYYNDTGLAQDTHIKAGRWAKTISPNDVRFPVLNAQGDGSGSYIACSITEAGEVIAENKSKGPFSVVSCQPPS